MSEISTALSELQRAVGRIEGTLNALDGKIDAHIEEDREMSKKLDVLTARQSFADGRASIIGTIGGILGGALASWLVRHGS